jgi:hypothetical protein
MKLMTHKTLFATALVLAISACSDDNDDSTTSSQAYRISITNLTHAQPLSPPIAMLHDSTFNWWSIGDTASSALEMMAEGGDGSALLALAAKNPQHHDSDVLLPGSSTEFTLTMTEESHNRLSVSGMLVNTNDAFSGLNSAELESLLPGQNMVYYSNVYDAGTEMNSELAGTIPGPADGGSGFDAARDDVTSVVTLHGGVVSSDDGLATSALGDEHKFDNAALRIEVTAL